MIWKFGYIRKKTPALKYLLVPDELWPQFKKFCLEEFDEAYHRSILLLAFRRNYLIKIIEPIHKYLFENGEPKQELSSQYKKDLQERWMIKKSVIERHQKFRQYMGKMIELLIADLLEKQNWKIIDLEALSAKSDIISESPDNGEQAIEVKYIGQRDDVFESVVVSLSGSSGGGSISLYDLADYILLRVYEAAKQLEKQNLKRTVIIVISKTWWNFVDTQINEGWINWKSPSFYLKTPGIRSYINGQKYRYPQIYSDLLTTIKNLSSIFFVKENDDLNFSIVQHIQF